MFKPLPMLRIELSLLKDDAPQASLLLANYGNFDPEFSEAAPEQLPELPGESYRQAYTETRAHLDKILAHYEVKTSETVEAPMQQVAPQQHAQQHQDEEEREPVEDCAVLVHEQAEGHVPQLGERRAAEVRVRRGRRHAQPRGQQEQQMVESVKAHSRDAAGEHVASHERVAPVSRPQPLPCDQHVRPAATRVGLERHVQQPDLQGPERGIGKDLDEHPQLLGEARHVVGLKEPCQAVRCEDQERDAEGPRAVAPAEPDVPAREEQTAQRHRESEQHDAGVAHGQARRRRGRGLHALGLRPRRLDLEPHGAAPIGGRLDSERRIRTGQVRLPRRLVVRVDRGRPAGRRRGERGRVEAGLTEERQPPRRGPRAFRVVDLRRDLHEAQEAPLRV